MPFDTSEKSDVVESCGVLRQGGRHDVVVIGENWIHERRRLVDVVIVIGWLQILRDLDRIDRLIVAQALSQSSRCERM